MFKEKPHNRTITLESKTLHPFPLSPSALPKAFMFKAKPNNHTITLERKTLHLESEVLEMANLVRMRVIYS